MRLQAMIDRGYMGKCWMHHLSYWSIYCHLIFVDLRVFWFTLPKSCLSYQLVLSVKYNPSIFKMSIKWAQWTLLPQIAFSPLICRQWLHHPLSWLYPVPMNNCPSQVFISSEGSNIYVTQYYLRWRKSGFGKLGNNLPKTSYRIAQSPNSVCRRSHEWWGSIRRVNLQRPLLAGLKQSTSICFDRWQVGVVFSLTSVIRMHHVFSWTSFIRRHLTLSSSWRPWNTCLLFFSVSEHSYFVDECINVYIFVALIEVLALITLH